MTRAALLHILPDGTWEEALQLGRYQPPSLAVEGFIHLSWDHQLVATLARHYDGVGGLSVLVIDPGRLDMNHLVEEAAADAQDRFPHYYEPLPLDAVAAVVTSGFLQGRLVAFDNDDRLLIT